MGIIVKTTRVYRFVKNLEHFLIFIIDSYKFKSSQIPWPKHFKAKNEK